MRIARRHGWDKGQTKSKALKEIIEGNELFKKQNESFQCYPCKPLREQELQ
jgi:hypothetical protein